MELKINDIVEIKGKKYIVNKIYSGTDKPDKIELIEYKKFNIIDKIKNMI